MVANRILYSKNTGLTKVIFFRPMQWGKTRKIEIDVFRLLYLKSIIRI